MEESSLLKVEDILPLLSDDTTIDHFKVWSLRQSVDTMEYTVSSSITFLPPLSPPSSPSPIGRHMQVSE